MYGSVKIGSKVVEMSANAASPYFYKRTFGEDFLLAAQRTETPDIYIYVKMGFIMAQTAQKSLEDLCKLKESDFLKWVSEFNTVDIMNALPEIVSLYAAQESGDSTPKKEDG